jgi:hypothetical protein
MRVWPIMWLVRLSLQSCLDDISWRGRLFYTKQSMNFIEIRLMSFFSFKIDFGKTYDKVKWPFMKQVICTKGFDLKWCKWIMDLEKGVSVEIRVNDNIGYYFQT